MHPMLRTAVATAILLGLTGTACSSRQGPDALTKVSFRLNWTLYGEHATYFVALDKGFYRDEGLDVEILEGSGSATTVKLVGNGTNPLGYSDVASAMRGISVGVPVRAVAVPLQVNPMAVIHLADVSFRDARDLPGKTIAVTTGDSLSQLFMALLEVNRIPESAVTLVAMANPAAKETAMLERKVDALLGYYHDQPLRIEQQHAVDLEWLRFTDLGITTLSGAIIAQETLLRDDPDLVRRFLAGTVRGIRYTIENPEEAATIFMRHAPHVTPETAREQIRLAGELRHTPRTIGRQPGWSHHEDWKITEELLARYAGLKPAPDVSAYYTNDFLPPVR